MLVVSQACAAPLAAMVLYLSPPYCFIALLSAYLFGKLSSFRAFYKVICEIDFVDISFDISADGHYGQDKLLNALLHFIELRKRKVR